MSDDAHSVTTRALAVFAVFAFMLFALKQFVSTLASPLLVAMLLIGVGVALLAASRRRGGLCCALGGLALLALASFGPLVNRAERALGSYPAYQKTAESMGPAIRHIVVLGGGHQSSPGLAATHWLGPSAKSRLLEGLRVHRLHPESRLLFTGQNPGDSVSHAQAYASAAQALGIPKGSLSLEERGRNTAEEARAIARRLDGQPFVLVTSNWHMPRAMWLMRIHGAQPIPAPAAHYAGLGAGGVWRWNNLFSVRHLAGGFAVRYLAHSDLLLHEALGLLWIWLGGDRAGSQPGAAPERGLSSQAASQAAAATVALPVD